MGLLTAAINVFLGTSDARPRRMTATEHVDLLSSDQPPCTSLPPLPPSELPSRTYSSVASTKILAPSPDPSPISVSTTTSSAPLLLAPHPRWTGDKLQREQRKVPDSYIRDLETRNAKLEKNLEHLRLEKEEIVKDRDSKTRVFKTLGKKFQKLERDHQELKDTRQQELLKVEKDRDQAVSQLNEVVRMYEEMEKLKNGSDAALAEVRQFVTTCDPADGNFLLQKLTDFNTLVDDFAFNLSTELADPSQSLQVDQLLHVVQSLPHQLVPMTHQALQLPNPRTLTFDDVTIGYTRAILHWTIASGVWERFSWNLIPEFDSLLSTVYRDLCDAEPQALHARWRSLTYQTILRSIVGNPASELAAYHYDTLLLPLYDNIILHSGKKMSPQVTPLCLAELELILTSAFEVHKLIRQDYLSVNYDILAPPPSSHFDPETMERVEASQSSSRPHLEERVVACVGAGLTRTAQEDDGKGQKVRRTLIVKKAEVLTTRWFERSEEAEGEMVCER